METSGMADDESGPYRAFERGTDREHPRCDFHFILPGERERRSSSGKDYDEFSGAYTDDDVIRFVEKIVVGADKVSVVFKAGISVDVMR